jgi:hypothetical protein
MSHRTMLQRALCAGCLLLAVGAPASADEGGVGFWMPGLYGSLAAVPGVPGWSFGALYLHNHV